MKTYWSGKTKKFGSKQNLLSENFGQEDFGSKQILSNRFGPKLCYQQNPDKKKNDKQRSFCYQFLLKTCWSKEC